MTVYLLLNFLLIETKRWGQKKGENATPLVTSYRTHERDL